jgi:hypothetical protein
MDFSGIAASATVPECSLRLKSTRRNVMKTLQISKNWTRIGAIALAGLLLGTVGDVRAAEPQQQLTRREARQLKAMKSPEDHSKLAQYYKAEADKLDAAAAGYEEAAATYRQGPMVKNLISPTTPGRYEYIGKTYREKANSDRELATSHEQMAKNAAAGL